MAAEAAQFEAVEASAAMAAEAALDFEAAAAEAAVAEAAVSVGRRSFPQPAVIKWDSTDTKMAANVRYWPRHP